MFLTITIDTNQKKKKSLRFKTRKTDLAWWRKPLNIKKRSLKQKYNSWIKKLKGRRAYFKPAMY